MTFGFAAHQDISAGGPAQPGMRCCPALSPRRTLPVFFTAFFSLRQGGRGISLQPDETGSNEEARHNPGSACCPGTLFSRDVVKAPVDEQDEAGAQSPILVGMAEHGRLPLFS